MKSNRCLLLFIGLTGSVLSADTGPNSGFKSENSKLAATSIESHRPEAFPAPSWSPRSPGYTVVVDVTVNEQGTSEAAVIHASDDPSPEQILNTIALKLAADFKQPPKLKDGQSVKAVARVPFFFPVERDEGPDANRAPRPKLLSGAPVAYPADLAAQHTNGGAIVELIIDERGQVDRVDVLAQSHRSCGAAVRTAVSSWRFEPAKQGGLAVRSRWRIAVAFNADGSVGDLKWRIAPRPCLASYTVTPATK